MEGLPKQPQWKDGTEESEVQLTDIDKTYEQLGEEERKRRLREIG